MINCFNKNNLTIVMLMLRRKTCVHPQQVCLMDHMMQQKCVLAILVVLYIIDCLGHHGNHQSN